MAQMRAQQAAQQAKKGGPPPKQKPEVHLVAVPRENSILANAPPDQDGTDRAGDPGDRRGD